MSEGSRIYLNALQLLLDFVLVVFKDAVENVVLQHADTSHLANTSLLHDGACWQTCKHYVLNAAYVSFSLRGVLLCTLSF